MFMIGLLFLLLLSEKLDGLNILAASQVATKSHKFFMDAILGSLAEKGHHITVLSPFPSSPKENITEIGFDSLSKMFLVNDWFGDIQEERKKVSFSLTPLSDIIDQFMEIIINTTLTDERVKQLFHKKFDLLILDACLNEFLLPISVHSNIPTVYISPVLLFSWVQRTLGATVDYDAYQYVPTDTYFGRVYNHFITNLHEIDLNYVYYPKMEKLIKDLYPTDYSIPSTDEMVKTVDMVLVNSHYSMGSGANLPPNIIDIGGIHCKGPANLPLDIEEFISDGDEGVILFSLGSAIPSEQMPKQYLDAFANAFRRLPQKIIWRWSGEPFENVPENVMLRSWLPQQDIAGHPKTRLLISHGGMLSTTEAICHGIPILGLPFWGDQDANIALAVRDGYGLKLEWNDLTEDLLYNTITELLNNTQYTRIVKKRQELFHDRPMKPLDEAVYWVEHILRHGGGQHLSPATRNLNRFQAKMLDVYLFLLGAVSIILILIAGSLYALLSIVRRFISPQLKQKLN
ncbi:UDP-glycosyltransferase UGT5-like isoform X4 [Artemia franciscana]